MRYNVAGLLKSHTGTTRVVELDEPFRRSLGDAVLVAPVHGEVELVRDPGGIQVFGLLDTVARMPCARCLETTDVELTVDLSEHFRPTVAIEGGPAIVVDPDEERETATEIDIHHMLDLSEVLWQNFTLALPMHPLCRPDCAGLCPICGNNRNTEPCGCQPPGDPRWQALSAWQREPIIEEPSP